MADVLWDQCIGKYIYIPGNSFLTFLGWLSDPFKWLSDLQLGDEKVTLNHLVYIHIYYIHGYYGYFSSPDFVVAHDKDDDQDIHVVLV